MAKFSLLSIALLAVLSTLSPAPTNALAAEHNALARREDFPSHDSIARKRGKAPKVGLGWSSAAPKSGLHYWHKSSVGGLYTWTPFCPEQAAEVGIPCFPMLWGPKYFSKWEKLEVKKYHTAIGCNEVNQPGQAKMSPSEGATIWRKYLMPLKKKHNYKLISHSISSSKTGAQWFRDYKKHCKECWDTTDRLNVHFYGNDPNKMISYLKSIHSEFKKTLWVTEFACHDFSGHNKQCTPSMVKHFLDAVTHFMDETEWIEMYFWFGLYPSNKAGNVNKDNSLMNKNGSPNSLGEDYLKQD